MVLGRGIGYKKKAGHLQSEILIEKVLPYPVSETAERYMILLSKIPLACVLTADQIIILANRISLRPMTTAPVHHSVQQSHSLGRIIAQPHLIVIMRRFFLLNAPQHGHSQV